MKYIHRQRKFNLTTAKAPPLKSYSVRLSVGFFKFDLCSPPPYPVLFLIIFILTLFIGCGYSYAASHAILPVKNIAGLDHSMRSPFKYAFSKIPMRVAEMIAKNKIEKIVVFQGGKEECERYFGSAFGMGSLEEFEDTYRDGSKTSFYKITGRNLYIDYKNYGRDMAVHKALLYQFCGLACDKIELLVYKDRLASNPLFAKSAEAAGSCEIAVIGYVRSFVRDFTLRKKASQKAEYLRDFLSSPLNYYGLLKRVKIFYTARRPMSGSPVAEVVEISHALSVILNSDPSLFFKYSAYYYLLQDLEARFLKISSAGDGFDDIMLETGFKFYPINGKYDFKAGEYIQSGFDIRRFLVTGNDGVKRRLLITRHPYGEQARALKNELYAAGARRILFLGSCGGFDDDLNAGDIIISRAFYRYDQNGEFYPPMAGNDAFGFFKAEVNKPNRQCAPFKLKNYHISVPSPLVETKKSVDEFINKKISSVDCESFYLFENKEPSRSMASIFIVTDLPLKEHTLESYDSESPLIRKAQMRALDLIIQYFQISGVEVN